ncbi:DUF2865 domain-containing protein [Salinarimonas sp.]|uniref:DUF2865 domain-containing protein n=1 Tax=Salinarimonas sp. TaxID=2766526 RepID=UPI00391B0DCA
MTGRIVTQATGADARVGRRSHRGRVLGLALAIGLSAGVSASGAATAADEPVRVADLGGGFIEFLFGGARGRATEAPVVEAPRPARPATRSDPRPAAPAAPAARQPAAPAQSAGGGGGAIGLAFCVRTCDGFGFPVGALRSRADASAHRAACVAACPGAATRLFVGNQAGGFTQARAFDDGTPYAALENAFRNRRERVPDCTCQAPDPRAARLAALAADVTLRRGDLVATTDGVLVFDGRGRLEELDASGAASQPLRRLADRKLGLSLRATKLERWMRERPQARVDASLPEETSEQLALAP